jgi:hypothetical protein
MLCLEVVGQQRRIPGNEAILFVAICNLLQYVGLVANAVRL